MFIYKFYKVDYTYFIQKVRKMSCTAKVLQKQENRFSFSPFLGDLVGLEHVDASGESESSKNKGS